MLFFLFRVLSCSCSIHIDVQRYTNIYENIQFYTASHGPISCMNHRGWVQQSTAIGRLCLRWKKKKKEEKKRKGPVYKCFSLDVKQFPADDSLDLAVDFAICFVNGINTFRFRSTSQFHRSWLLDSLNRSVTVFFWLLLLFSLSSLRDIESPMSRPLRTICYLDPDWIFWGYKCCFFSENWIASQYPFLNTRQLNQ